MIHYKAGMMQLTKVAKIFWEPGDYREKKITADFIMKKTSPQHLNSPKNNQTATLLFCLVYQIKPVTF